MHIMATPQIPFSLCQETQDSTSSHINNHDDAKKMELSGLPPAKMLVSALLDTQAPKAPAALQPVRPDDHIARMYDEPHPETGVTLRDCICAIVNKEEDRWAMIAPLRVGPPRSTA